MPHEKKNGFLKKNVKLAYKIFKSSKVHYATFCRLRDGTHLWSLKTSNVLVTSEALGAIYSVPQAPAHAPSIICSFPC